MKVCHSTVLGRSAPTYHIKVSDPDHSLFGQYLSHHEVRQLSKPSDETLGLIQTWFRAYEIHNLRYSASEDSVYVRLNVSTLEHLLSTQYHIYRHDDGDSM